MTCKEKFDEIVSFLESLMMPRKVIEVVCIQYYEFDDVANILRKQKNINTIMEIGSYVGLSTVLLSVFSSKLISVDPNLDIKADCDKYNVVGYGKSRNYFDRVIKRFGKNSITKYDNYFSKTPNEKFVKFHQKYDENLCDIPILPLEKIQKEKIDVVFLDGDHYRDGVLSDLNKISMLNYLPRLIILHDVKGTWGKEICEAVKQFRKQNKLYKRLRKQGNVGCLKLRRKYGV